MRNKSKATVGCCLLILCLQAVTACRHNNDVTPVVSFSKDIVPILTASCAINSSCHLVANSLNLGTALDSADAYTTIIAKKLVSTSTPSSSLLYVEVQSGEMPKPPAAALPAGQQALILEWIQQGAKNN